MDTLIDNYDVILSGFEQTVRLLLASGVLALVVGTLVAIARVAPVPILRSLGSAYVILFRNTPLLVLILITFYGLPEIGIDFGLFWMIVLAMGLYTASFVSEALRSGVNGIPLGQAEAARSIGMPFGTTMTQVVLPQAARLTVPPMASVFIALTKNTSLAAAFGTADATFRLRGLTNDHPGDLWWIFGGIALGYVVIVEVLSFGAARLEKRWAA